MKPDKSKLFEELLIDLEEKTIRLLLEKIEDKTATSAEIAQVVQLLKHNDINIDITESEVKQSTKDKLRESIAGESVIPFAREA